MLKALNTSRYLSYSVEKLHKLRKRNHILSNRPLNPAVLIRHNLLNETILKSFQLLYRLSTPILYSVKHNSILLPRSL